MPDKTCKLTLGALALLAAVANTSALAQQDRWFRVELLIFANESAQQPEGAAIAEQWEATPTLGYPLASRFLIDPARVAQNAAEFDGKSLVDEYGRQIITILTAGALDTGATAPTLPDEALNVPDVAQPAPVPVPPTPVYQGGAPTDSAPAGIEPAAAKPLTLPRPCVLLAHCRGPVLPRNPVASPESAEACLTGRESQSLPTGREQKSALLLRPVW